MHRYIAAAAAATGIGIRQVWGGASSSVDSSGSMDELDGLLGNDNDDRQFSMSITRDFMVALHNRNPIDLELKRA